jgi:HSP20 family molecular chaperone IbpA
VSRNGIFTSPYLIGFDQVERMLDRVAKTASDGYPPYNIEQIGPDALRITLAVAGFSRSELQITLEDKQLVIRGRREEKGERIYLHRGIATRQFQRNFVLLDWMEVEGASLDHGLLHIDLVRPKPNIAVKEIAIADGGVSSKQKLSEAHPGTTLQPEEGPRRTDRPDGGREWGSDDQE